MPHSPTPLHRLLQLRAEADARVRARTAPLRMQISIGMATCGISAGGAAVWDALQQEITRLGLTDVQLKRVGCIGQCHAEPLVEVMAKGGMPFLYGHLTPELAVKVLHRHLNGEPPLAKYLVDGMRSYRLEICGGPQCPRTDHRAILTSLTAALQDFGLTDTVSLAEMGCPGRCQSSPTMIVFPGDYVYRLPSLEDVRRVVEEHLVHGTPVDALRVAPENLPDFIHTQNVPTVAMRQLRIASRNCGVIDPESLDEALVTWQYQALAAALTGQPPETVMQAVIDSGLRGRGRRRLPHRGEVGAMPQSRGGREYIDLQRRRGRPGRLHGPHLLEADPHTRTGGHGLAALCHGRAARRSSTSAPSTRWRCALREAIARARRADGLLGDHLLGSRHFASTVAPWTGRRRLCLRRGDGADRNHRGKTRHAASCARPTPSEQGLWGQTHLINNVETYACVPPITLPRRGWFAGMGTAKSKGTKVFALAGKMARTGLVEVPMGITLREIVYEIGGGIGGGKHFKAVQIGGPSGGCLPAALAIPRSTTTRSPQPARSWARAGWWWWMKTTAWWMWRASFCNSPRRSRAANAPPAAMARAACWTS